MDVQVVAAATGQPLAPEPQPAAPAAAELPSQPQAQVQSQPLPQPLPQPSAALSPIVAKIFGKGGSAPAPVTVNVSYRVEHDPDMIVTVFTDPKTGEEIAQVPAEVMIQIAQFFDKESGVTLDRSV